MVMHFGVNRTLSVRAGVAGSSALPEEVRSDGLTGARYVFAHPQANKKKMLAAWENYSKHKKL